MVSIRKAYTRVLSAGELQRILEAVYREQERRRRAMSDYVKKMVKGSRG